MRLITTLINNDARECFFNKKKTANRKPEDGRKPIHFIDTNGCNYGPRLLNAPFVAKGLICQKN